eukprot:scaffold9267_cov112-Isochrysis_galbana.AAC.2
MALKSSEVERSTRSRGTGRRGTSRLYSCATAARPLSRSFIRASIIRSTHAALSIRCSHQRCSSCSPPPHRSSSATLGTNAMGPSPGRPPPVSRLIRASSRLSAASSCTASLLPKAARMYLWMKRPSTPIASQASSSDDSREPQRTHDRHSARATHTRTLMPGSTAAGGWRMDASSSSRPPRAAHSTAQPSMAATTRLPQGSSGGRQANRESGEAAADERAPPPKPPLPAAAPLTSEMAPAPCANSPLAHAGAASGLKPAAASLAGWRGGGAPLATTAMHASGAFPAGRWVAGSSPTVPPASATGGARKKSPSCSSIVGRLRARYSSCGHNALCGDAACGGGAWCADGTAVGPSMAVDGQPAAVRVSRPFEPSAGAGDAGAHCGCPVHVVEARWCVEDGTLAG